jgi:rhodanese-related sulfurtransferase
MSVPTIDVSALPEGVKLLDVRELDEWTAGHAPTATHIAMGDVIARLDEVVAHDAPLYVICRAGGRSGQVVQYLVGNGIDAVNVAGGMQAWAASGRPMVSENGGAAQVI